MLKTNTQIKKTIFTAVFALFMIPTLASAGHTGSYDSGSWNGNSGWGEWGGNSPTYDYSYTPNYSYTPSYSSPSYTPSYSSPSYNYGSSYTPSYYTPSYSGSSYSGYSLPSYSSSYYGGYSLPSYGSSYTSSYIPNSNYISNTTSNNNANTNNSANTNNNLSNSKSNSNSNSNSNSTSTSNSTSNSNSTSSSTATAINNNVNNNNVYVYTNPTGNAVVHNPSRVLLDGYCTITPSNPRPGQSVTATAYATGGIGNYTYTWGGDINSVSGASTSFTSYTTGKKYINITIRSDQEIITKTCNVTFENNNSVYGNYYNSYTPSYTGGSSVSLTPGITSGTPVSGVYLSQLPATGLSLSFFDYMVATMVVILGAVFAFIYQAKKRLTIENI